MYSVMVSIDAEDCTKLFNGRKTLDMRKSMPAIQLPIRCYICCKNPQRTSEKLWKTSKGSYYIDTIANSSQDNCCNGKIIGEYVCKSVTPYLYQLWNEGTEQQLHMIYDKDLKSACMSFNQFKKYAGRSNVYGWHISDVIEYDVFKEVTSFTHNCKWFGNAYSMIECEKCKHSIESQVHGEHYKCEVAGVKVVNKPPTSWCYVHNS